MKGSERKIFGLSLLAVLAGSVSCGGGDSSGSCGMGAACGGDLVGTWKVVSSCTALQGTLTDTDCPTATLDGRIEFAGTATYTSAKTYTLVMTVSGTETILFPSTCLSATCDQLSQKFQATPPDGFSAMHCTSAAGGACSCAGTLIPQPHSETGTYTTSGGSVTTTPTDGSDAETDQYCVKGNRLDIVPDAPSLDPTLTASGDIILTRQ
jgi:hypothetical protein